MKLISRGKSVARRLWSVFSFKDIVDQCLLPFVVGFICSAVLIYGYNMVQAKPVSREEIMKSLPQHIVDDRGQLHLVRHGIQYTKMDIVSTDYNQMLSLSIVAPANQRFQKRYVKHRPQEDDEKPRRGGVYNEPPGTIWPWPRIESEGREEPLVWVVTPTFRSPVQYAELTRTAQALFPARKFVRWLVVDDSTKSDHYPDHFENLEKFLKELSINVTIFKSIPKPAGQKSMFQPKGVAARRTALKYARKMNLKGVIYFADDDNTYDSDIFRQMQETKSVSIWPTGAITQWTISSPVVSEKGKVVDFFDAFVAQRVFPVDFASFAVNLDYITENENANIPWIGSYEETGFLSSLNIDKADFMPLAANATELLTWHTKTIKPRTRVDRDTLELTSWPMTVKALINKYDFLFHYDDEKVSKMKQKRASKMKKPTVPVEKKTEDPQAILDEEHEVKKMRVVKEKKKTKENAEKSEKNTE